jgi:hypothetical protein
LNAPVLSRVVGMQSRFPLRRYDPKLNQDEKEDARSDELVAISRELRSSSVRSAIFIAIESKTKPSSVGAASLREMRWAGLVLTECYVAEEPKVH